MPPRDQLRETYKGYPAVGAVHPVIANSELRNALNTIADIADNVFEDQYMIHNHAVAYEVERQQQTGQIDDDAQDHLWIYDPNRYYRLFDAQTLGLSILEMDVSARMAEKARVVWQGKDLGALRQDLENEAARQLPHCRLQLAVNGIMPVGGKLPMAPNAPVRSKLAFNIDPAFYNETLELIFREYDILAQAVKNRLGKKNVADVVPVDFVPHISFLAYKHQATPEQIAEVNKQVHLHLIDNPLMLNLGQLTTERSRLVGRSKRRN